MKINKDLSAKILTISESINGKGGVVSVVTTYKSYFHNFNHLASIKQGNVIYKLSFFIIAIIKSIFILSSKKIKIVHIHSASKGSFFRKTIFLYISKLFNKKVILHIHGSVFKEFYRDNNYLNFIDKSLNKADLVVVLSESWYVFFKDIVKDESKIKIVHNIVENDRFEEERIIDYPIKLLFLGEIGDRKGVFDLIEVINDNRETLEEKIELTIGGNGEVDKLEEFIRKHNLNSLIKFKGWISGENKRELLKINNVYILPSYNEGLPISILEAMSYKMPIISTSVGGITEIVKDGKNGLIIEPGNKEEIKKSLLFFVNNKDVISEMGKKSLEIVKPYYAENVIKEINDVYLNLLK